MPIGPNHADNVIIDAILFRDRCKMPASQLLQACVEFACAYIFHTFSQILVFRLLHQMGIYMYT